MSREYNFEFSGKSIDFTLEPGAYTFEVWGAQGGGSNGGRGGYSKGTLLVEQLSQLQINVGGQNGWNGGGKSLGHTHVGGGASDVRINGTTLNDRFIVAGGGGGGSKNKSDWTGGAGGGLEGGPGREYGGYTIAGGTQTTGFALGQGGYIEGQPGTYLNSDCRFYGGGGGGGYYGGNCIWTAISYVDSTAGTMRDASGAGGSGYLSSILTNSTMTQGARTGNGIIKITVDNFNPSYVNIVADKITVTRRATTVSKLEMYINGNLIETITPIEDVNEFIINKGDCLTGINNIEIVTTFVMNDVEESKTNVLRYVKYGEKIPTTADLSMFALYLHSMEEQVDKLYNDLKSIVTDKGFDTTEIYKITDLVSLIENMTNENTEDINTLLSRVTALESEIASLQMEVTANRGNLATVLTDEGVSVTEEDNMDSLITKVDTEFNDKNTEMSSLNTTITLLNSQINSLTSELAGKVTPAGTAVAGDVLSGKTFINSTGKTVTGTMANRGGAQTVTPGTSNKTLNAGYYSGNITVAGDADLIAANIVSGKNIFGVDGTAPSVMLTEESLAGKVSKTPSLLVLGPDYTGHVASGGVNIKKIHKHKISCYVRITNESNSDVYDHTVRIIAEGNQYFEFNLKSNTNKTLTFHYTPSKTGEMTLQVQIKNTSISSGTKTERVQVNAEVFERIGYLG